MPAHPTQVHQSPVTNHQSPILRHESPITIYELLLQGGEGPGFVRGMQTRGRGVETEAGAGVNSNLNQAVTLG
jgi:hypothetical protein